MIAHIGKSWATLEKNSKLEKGDYQHNTRVVCYRQCVIAVLHGDNNNSDLGVKDNITIKSNYMGDVPFKDLFEFREAFIRNNKGNPILENFK